MRKIPADFISGLNRDTAKTRQSKSHLYFAENIQILTEQGASTGSVTNVKGNLELTINDPSDVLLGYDRSDYKIIASTSIRNDIVLFYQNNTLTQDLNGDDYSANHIIDLLKYESENVYTRIELWSGAGLNFRIDKPITIIPRYENDNIIKIYWSDGNEQMRVANIAPDEGATDLYLEASYSRIQGSTLSDFDRIADFIPFQPDFLSYTTGKLRAGAIQYAYRLYNRNGSETLFSPLSMVIPLTYADMTSLRKLRGQSTAGQGIDTQTSKGVVGSIPLGATNAANFDRIEIISLFYTSATDTPEINIIDRQPTATTITFTDTGTQSFGTLSYAEYLELQADISFTAAAVKDNRLFISNISEEYFDVDTEATWSGKSPGDIWDARVYRFASSTNSDGAKQRQAYLFDNYTDVSPAYTIDGTSGTWKTDPYSSNGAADIPHESNLLNKFNNMDDDLLSGDDNQFMFKADGTTIGGEGINISYTLPSTTSTGATVGSDGAPAQTFSTSTRYAYGMNRSWQQDEVYRMGIVFFDDKGRRSFVKWVGDIRMPIIDSCTNSTSTVTFNALLPTFTVSNIPTINGTTLFYQLVYVKRNIQDRTVLTSGVISKTEESTIAGLQIFQHPVLTWAGGVPVTYSPSFRCPLTTPVQCSTQLEMATPDTFFNDISFLGTGGLKLYIVEVLDNYVMGDMTTAISTYGYRGMYTYTNGSAYTLGVDLPIIEIHSYAQLAPVSSSALEDHAVSLQDDGVGQILVSNGVGDTGTGGNNLSQAHATTLVLGMDTVMDSIDIATAPRALVKRANLGQYGGFTYVARANNIYIPASEVTNGGTSYCKYGDINLQLFELLRIMTIDGTESGNIFMQEIAYLPTESTFNLNFQHGVKILDIKEADNSFWIKEDVGVYGKSLTESFTQNFPKYAYDNVYNKLSDADLATATPIDYSNVVNYPTRVRYSNLKINGEERDSWLKFNANDFNDTDTIHGNIQQLVEFNNDILCFQETGISLISVNPRVTQVGEDGVSTILGTGEVLDRFQYITTEIGLQNFNRVIKSIGALYWLDINKKKLYSYGGNGLISISDRYGMDSYFKNNINDISHMIGVYDPKHASIYFTIKPQEVEYTINGGSLIPSLVTSDNQVVSIAAAPYPYYDLTYYSDEIDIDPGAIMEIGGCVVQIVSIDPTNGVIRLNPLITPPTPHLGNNNLPKYIKERNNFTLSFNESLGVFESFHSFRPAMYIKIPQGFISTQDRIDLYYHNKGERGSFYGTVYPSAIELIYSDSGIESLEFNNLEYFSEISTKDMNYKNETLNSMQAFTDYQTSDEIILLPMSLTRYELDTSAKRILSDVDNYAVLSNIRKNIEHWRCSLPRTINSELTTDRLRSSNYRLRLVYDNAGDKRLVLHTVITTAQEMLL